MDAMERLRAHLATRMPELVKAKRAGTKIVGIAPGGFIPEEMIYAAGAIPIILGKGGDPEPTMEALAMNTRFICTFCRTQIGYWKLGEAVDYKLPDLLVVPVVDANNKLIADSFSYFAGWDTYRVGVPHDKLEEHVAYYKFHLQNLKAKLEELTGNTITDEKLKAEIEIGNKRRSLLKAISYLRIGADPVISSKDYVALHHGSFHADRDVYIEILQDVYDELKAKRVEGITKRPRVMLIASTLALGDNRIHEIMDETDSEIVCEEVSEGMVPYLHNVELTGGDVMDAIVDCYFTKRIKGPWDRPWDGRFEDLLAMAQEFDCGGVIWYQTMFRDGPDLQAWSFAKKFKANGISFVKIETDYTAAERGPMRTRIETFAQLMEQGSEFAEAVI